MATRSRKAKKNSGAISLNTLRIKANGYSIPNNQSGSLPRLNSISSISTKPLTVALKLKEISHQHMYAASGISFGIPVRGGI